jgi:hypothetical protein
MTPTMSTPSPRPASAISRGLSALPAWSVYAWPALVCRAHQPPDWRLTHLSTCILNPGNDSQPCSGQTLWGSDLETGAAALAWDWVRLCPGVVALADPLGLVSNLHLVDEAGAPLPSLQAALHLNELVRALPWQHEVQRALQHHALN